MRDALQDMEGYFKLLNEKTELRNGYLTLNSKNNINYTNGNNGIQIELNNVHYAYSNGRKVIYLIDCLI